MYQPLFFPPFEYRNTCQRSFSTKLDRKQDAGRIGAKERKTPARTTSVHTATRTWRITVDSRPPTIHFFEKSCKNVLRTAMEFRALRSLQLPLTGSLGGKRTTHPLVDTSATSLETTRIFKRKDFCKISTTTSGSTMEREVSLLSLIHL